ncbi:conserved domain-containing protein [Clostridium cavendishii DSM 21758]|uniref:Conserved domain-containing protein n=1 Tax=Clostridium cavendishii DSM 21758 TaxID=1121302 RepID=A0A1M6NJ49_9CLOT|nr:YsnF/AvaK domain-containing protein [Clostridium cavendishii]SHJ95710.1 conserved domain-containing protein [Clostridium cavendishii DSM 21758]
MSIFGEIFGDDSNNKEAKHTDDDATLRLRKEELDIAKSRVQRGEVELGKEIIEEHKIVDVPVEREEVVIERKSLNNEASDSPIAEEETIRIPVTEEKIDVNKRTVLTSEVSAHKHTVEDTKHVDETLKREEARINNIGNADIIDSNNYQD